MKQYVFAYIINTYNINSKILQR